MSKQENVQRFISECGHAMIFVKNEMSLGAFHDFLMEIKGSMVARMVEAQQKEEEHAKAAMENVSPALQEELSECSDDEQQIQVENQEG